MREEIDAIDLKAYANKAEELLAHLAEEIGHFYKTRCPVTGPEECRRQVFPVGKDGDVRGVPESISRLSFSVFRCR